MAEKINLNSEWIAPYKKQRTIDFTATDFLSTRNGLVSFIKLVAPENFNDYVANSELMILASSLAYISEITNYKVDMALNDQFIETTERTQSLLNFAKLTNYSVNRNHCAQGLIKIVEITTDEDIYDANGVSLKQIPILWNDPSNKDWYDQFITVINSALVQNNKFNQPIGAVTNNGVTTQLYYVDSSAAVSRLSYAFSSVVNGTNMNFEIVNAAFDSNYIIESAPHVGNMNSILYNNDYNGLASPATGFFLYFKQGTLKYRDYNFTENVQMQRVNLNDANINDEDIWVQEVDQNGYTLADWKAVKAPYNIIYNNEDLTQRKIYQVITELNDNVSIRFADGKFGKIPYGNFRIWYRTSNGLGYNIRKNDIQNISITIPYIHSTESSDEVYHITVRLQLVGGVNNALPTESKESTRLKIPIVNQTQNRMVTDEDYQTLPKAFTSQIKKLKTENRIYAGHSTYLNSNDVNPIKDVKIFSADGILRKDITNYYAYEELPTVKSVESLIYSNVQDMLESDMLSTFYYTQYPLLDWANHPVWSPESDNGSTQSGLFKIGNDYVSVGDGTTTTPARLVLSSALLKMVNVNDPENVVWVRVLNNKTFAKTNGNRTDRYVGVEIDTKIDGEYYVESILPPFIQSLSEDLVADLTDLMEAKTTSNVSNILSTYIGLAYDYLNQKWICIDGQYLNLEDDFDISTINSTATESNTAWMCVIKWSPTAWTFQNRKVDYIFESEDVQFTRPVDDFIDLIQFKDGSQFEIIDLTTSYNNHINAHSVQIKPFDFKVSDNPHILEDIQNPNSYVYYQKVEDNLDSEYVLVDITEVKNIADIPTVNKPYYVISQDGYYVKTDINSAFRYPDGVFIRFVGSKDNEFTWIHKTTKKVVIDPSPSPIIDMYVLTTEYYNQIISWKQNNYASNLYPAVPTSADLAQMFKFAEDFKMMTDLIVWHPLKLKLLFGSQADSELQAYVKVIPSETSLLSHGEIKQRVLLAIDNFFNIDNWEFGTTFNFPMLSTYIMQQMPYDLVSCVIVPKYSNLKFGNLYQIVFDKNEIPFSVATQQDIQIINAITKDNIRIGS